MNDFVEDIGSLELDANFEKPLRRVAYEAGMLLGLEATRDEQSYHRRRLNRHQYWLQGYGTLAGMAVSVSPVESTNNNPTLTRLIVSPGIGIDGLGREVLIHEPYGIDLGEWLQAQNATQLYSGYDDTNNVLHLKITVRQQDVPVGLQPVLARKFNLSTDAVQPSRMADSIQLDITPELPPAADNRYRPWAAHPAIVDADQPITETNPGGLNETEIEYLGVIQGANTNRGEQLQLHARLLHCLDGKGVSTAIAADQLEESARLLLARIEIDVPDLDALMAIKQGDPVVNPNFIRVNNLVRPFLVTASQLTFLLAN
jgi:hypothetical protein